MSMFLLMSMSMNLCVYMYVYLYVHVHVYVHVYLYVYGFVCEAWPPTSVAEQRDFEAYRAMDVQAVMSMCGVL